MDPSDREFLAEFMQASRHYLATAPEALRHPKAFEMVERRAAEILENPPLDLHHHVMDHIDELRQQQGGVFGRRNSELLEELGSHPQARRVFYAVIAACHELGPDLERAAKCPQPRTAPQRGRGL